MEQAGLFIRKQKSLQGNRAFLTLCPSACLAISDLGHPPAARLAVIRLPARTIRYRASSGNGLLAAYLAATDRIDWRARS